MGGWSGAILLNSPVDCELRRDMRRGIAEGLCGGPCRPKVGVWVTAFTSSSHAYFFASSKHPDRGSKQRLKSPLLKKCFRYAKNE